MSLTFGTGPFAPATQGRFDFEVPQHVSYWEPWPRRMRALLDGETVLDSERGVLLHRTGQLPLHLYPLADLRSDVLREAGHDAHGRRRWSLHVGDRVARRCVESSPLTSDGDELIPDHVSVAYEAIDLWFEEDEPIYGHPRDPYHRVDVRASSRHVVIRAGGHVVADTRRSKLLFETGNPIRYYLPVGDVRFELLTESTTVTRCPYKGDGHHWHLHVGGQDIEDAAWSLPHPLPEGLAAGQHICFYPEKVDVEVDGKRVS